LLTFIRGSLIKETTRVRILLVGEHYFGEKAGYGREQLRTREGNRRFSF